MNKRQRRRQTRKIIYSFILLFISFTMFVTATFAWFTNTATVKGNKVFAGNLYVDVIADRDVLAARGYSINVDGLLQKDGNNLYDVDGNTMTPRTYSRKTVDSVGATDTKEYYVLSKLEAPFLELYNVEPGQAYSVKFSVLNSGDLAAKYTAGFQISKDSDGNPRSYTGLETLAKQRSDSTTDPFGVYHNAYQVNGGLITNTRQNNTYDLSDVLSETEYNRRYKKLTAMQADPTKSEGEEGWDLGGHLEDVLEVYAVDPELLSDSGTPLHSTVTKEIEVDGERVKANYIGTVRQMIDLFDPAYTPETPEEESELQRVQDNMNRLSTNYILPQEVVKSDETGHEGEIALDGVTVNVYGELITPVSGDGDPYREYLGSRAHVSEIGNIEYIIYMPETADNKYQNASLFLDMGVTGSQVEFEIDGLNYMIYDKFSDLDHLISIADYNGYSATSPRYGSFYSSDSELAGPYLGSAGLDELEDATLSYRSFIDSNSGRKVYQVTDSDGEIIFGFLFRTMIAEYQNDPSSIIRTYYEQYQSLIDTYMTNQSGLTLTGSTYDSTPTIDLIVKIASTPKAFFETDNVVISDEEHKKALIGQCINVIYSALNNQGFLVNQDYLLNTGEIPLILFKELTSPNPAP